MHGLDLRCVTAACCSIALAALFGCQDSSSVTNSTEGDGPPPALAQDLSQPAEAFLPSPLTLAATLAEQRSLNDRSASYIESDLLRHGGEFTPALPHRLVFATGSGLNMTPHWQSGTDDSSSLAYAIYTFHVAGYDRENRVTLNGSWPQDDYQVAWIGLSHWATNHWDWYQNTPTGTVNVPNLLTYFSEDNDLFCVVLCTGMVEAALVSVCLGDPGLIAVLQASPSIGPAPLDSSLDASQSTTREGSITEYEWDLDFDGAFEYSSGNVPTAYVSITENMTAAVAVRVTNNVGQVAIARRNLTAVDDWAHTWGLNCGDRIVDTITDYDQNIYCTGAVYDDSTQTDDLLLMSWSPAGTLLWARVFSGGGNETGSYIDCSRYGDLLVLGETDFTGDSQVLVQCWTNSGELLWSSHFGGPGFDSPGGISTYPFLTVAGTTDCWSGSLDFFACKLNLDGTLGWARVRDHGGDDKATGHCAISPDGLVVIGEAYSAGISNAWRVEYLNSGEFNGGYELGTAAMPKSDLQVVAYYSNADATNMYHVSGVFNTGMRDKLFMGVWDSTGACRAGTSWWNDAMSTDTGYAVADLLWSGHDYNFFVAGSVPGLSPGSRYAMCWRFDLETCGFLDDFGWEHGVDSAVASAVADHAVAGNLIVCGSAPAAGGSWMSLDDITGAFSETWSSVNGSGGELLWTAAKAPGSIRDIAAEGVLDSGAGDQDGLLYTLAVP